MGEKWAETGAFDALLGKKARKKKNTPTLSFFGLKKMDTGTSIPNTNIAESSIPKSTIAKSSIPKNNIVEPGISKRTIVESDIPKTSIVKSDIPKKTIVESGIPKSTMPESDIPKTNIVEPGISKTTIAESGIPNIGFVSLPYNLFESVFNKLGEENAAKSIYVRLFRLSHGNKQDSIKVGYVKLEIACCISLTTVQRAVLILERGGFILRIQAEKFLRSVSLYTLPKPTGSYFIMPNSVFDDLFSKLKPTEQILYATLWRFSFGLNASEKPASSQNEKNETCSLGYADLIRASGLSKTRLVKSLRILQNQNIITRKTTGHTGSTYKLFEPFEIDFLKDSLAPEKFKSILTIQAKIKQTSLGLGISKTTIVEPGISKTGNGSSDYTKNRDQVYPKSELDIPKTDTFTTSSKQHDLQQQNVVDLLTKNNVHKGVAKKFVTKHPLPYIREKVSYVLRKNAEGTITDLGAAIAKAIREDWKDPEVEHEKEQEAKKLRKEQEKADRLTFISGKIDRGEWIDENEYDLLPPEMQDRLQVDELYYTKHHTWRYKQKTG